MQSQTKDILAEADKQKELDEASRRIAQMRLANVVDDNDDDDDDDEDEENENNNNNNEDDGSTGSPVATLSSLGDPESPTSNQRNNKKSSKSSQQDLRKAQEQQSVVTFLFLLLFFIGVSAMIHIGDSRELFHFLDEGWFVEVYIDRICYCNQSFTGRDNCHAMGDAWPIPTQLAADNPEQLYCLALNEDTNSCDNLNSRLDATHIMILTLFVTFVIINIVALSVTVVTVLRRILAERVDLIKRLLQHIAKLFGPSLLGALMFVPAASIVGLAASGVLISLFVDTMCRATPNSFFVRPAMYRNEFAVGSGATFILVGTMSGFIVLVGGIVYTVKSRAAISQLHEKEREVKAKKFLKRQRQIEKGFNVSERSKRSDAVMSSASSSSMNVPSEKEIITTNNNTHDQSQKKNEPLLEVGLMSQP